MKGKINGMKIKGNKNKGKKLTATLLIAVFILSTLAIAIPFVSATDPVLSLSVSSGTPALKDADTSGVSATSVEVTGTGFPSGQADIELRMALTTVTPSPAIVGTQLPLTYPSIVDLTGKVTADANGYFRAKFSVPQTAAGSYNIWAFYTLAGTPTISPIVDFTVLAGLKMVASYNLGTEGIYRTKVRIWAAGFQPEETVSIVPTNFLVETRGGDTNLEDFAVDDKGGTDAEPIFGYIAERSGGTITVTAAGTSPVGTPVIATCTFTIKPSIALAGERYSLKPDADSVNVIGRNWPVTTPSTIITANSMIIGESNTLHSPITIDSASKGTFEAPVTYISALPLGVTSVTLGGITFDFDNQNIIAPKAVQDEWDTYAAGIGPGGAIIVSSTDAPSYVILDKATYKVDGYVVIFGVGADLPGTTFATYNDEPVLLAPVSDNVDANGALLAVIKLPASEGTAKASNKLDVGEFVALQTEDGGDFTPHHQGGSATAEWSTMDMDETPNSGDEPYSGSYSVHLYDIDAGGDQAKVFYSIPAGSRPQLKDISELGFMEYIPLALPVTSLSTANLQLDLVLTQDFAADSIEDGTNQFALMFDSDYDVPDMGGYLPKDIDLTTGAWVTRDVGERLAWLSGGPDVGAGPKTWTNVVRRLSDWHDSSAWQGDTMYWNDYPDEVGDLYVSRITVLVCFGPYTGYDGYIDDITINGDGVVATSYVPITPKISISSSKLQYNEEYTITGKGFYPDASLAVTIGPYLWTTITEPVYTDGGFTLESPDLPALPDIPGGTYDVTVTGTTTGNVASHSGRSVKSLVQTDALAFSNGASGDVVPLLSGIGKGFHGLAANTLYDIYWDGPYGAKVGSFVSTAVGTMPPGVQFTVPSGVTGTHIVDIVKDGTSAIYGRLVSKVEQYVNLQFGLTASLEITPTVGFVDTNMVISGVGLAANTYYIVTISTDPDISGLVSYAAFTSTATGLVPEGVGFSFPSQPTTLELGTSYYVFVQSATDIQEEDYSGRGSFVLQANAIISPTTAAPGSTVTLTATGLAAGKIYNIIFDWKPTATGHTGITVGAIVANPLGSGSSTLTVPATATAGTYTIMLLYPEDVTKTRLNYPPTLTVEGAEPQPELPAETTGEEPLDSTGAPKSSFVLGEMVLASAEITNAGTQSQPMLIAVQWTDPEYRTLAPIFMITTLSSTQSFVFAPGLIIPTTGYATGTWTATILVFDTWPALGGVTIGEPVTITITVS